MGPLRKKSRPNPPRVEERPQTSDEPVEGPAPTSSTTTLAVTAASTTPPTDVGAETQDVVKDLRDPNQVPKSDASFAKTLRSTKSWYGGTWPRLQKSTASTKVARESILADKRLKNGTATADLSRFEARRPTMPDGRPPSMFLGKSKETSDVTLAGALKEGGDNDLDIKSKTKGTDSIQMQDKAQNKAMATGPPITSDGKPAEGPDSSTNSEAVTVQRPVTASSWLGWLGRPDGYKPVSSAEDDAKKTLLTSEAVNVQTLMTEELTRSSSAPLASEEAPKASTTNTSTSSWFSFWPSSEPPSTDAPKEEIPVKIVDIPEAAKANALTDHSAVKPAAGSSWAFWSSAEATKNIENGTDTPAQSGELAVVGEPSQSSPEMAQTQTSTADKKSKKKKKTVKRGRPELFETDDVNEQANQVDPTVTKATPSVSPAPSKSTPPNILLPSVKSTYHMMENPSILQQLARMLQLGQQRPVKHVFLSKDLPKIKKALAIGVHGLFPAPLLRTVIGQPTGTSIRFANYAAAALRRWADQHGCASCEIEKVALEGEGKIAERVDNLWKLLLNWIEHVRSADFILVACHSQGVPVAIMLVAKLIEFGVVTSGRIGICAMAGVSLGPFADYKSRLFSGSAGELFEFADPESAVSKRYQDSLRAVLKYGARVTYCGSIDDQLISMESSIFSTVSHPHIYRAVFIDGRIHAPDFIAHLVAFALKLRNLGVSDHGLIRELSAPLAGSLYTGEGHSRLYDDEKVYDLALEFALETTTVGDVPLEIKKYEILTTPNPYVLPWIMRGLLEEEFVKTELSTETAQLLKQFDDWKPATKVLKDVKYRLEAVRSKL